MRLINIIIILVISKVLIMPNCIHCDKPLRKIGKDRINGKLFVGNDGEDWSSRRYHKRCYKLKKEEETRDLVYFLREKNIISFD
jgi:hypothetical protein